MDSEIASVSALPVGAHSSYKPSYDYLFTGTEIVVPETYLTVGIPMAGKSTNIKSSMFPFMSGHLGLLIDDEGFVQDISIEDKAFGLTDHNPSASVWVWCRALGDGNHLTGRLVDITPFLEDMSVTKEARSGSFNVNLAYSYEDGKTLTSSSIYDAVMNSQNETHTSGSFAGFPPNSEDARGVPIDGTSRTKIVSRRRHHSQLVKMVQKNDIVFIRTSKLKMEKYAPNGMYVPLSYLDTMVFDMIGLVDRVTEAYAVGGAGVTITIAGLIS